MTDVSISLAGIGPSRGGRVPGGAALGVPAGAAAALCRMAVLAACLLPARHALPLPPFLFLATGFAAAGLAVAACGLARRAAGFEVSAIRAAAAERETAERPAAGMPVAAMVVAGLCLLLALRTILAVPGAGFADAWPVLAAALPGIAGLETIEPPAAGPGRLAPAALLALAAAAALALGGRPPAASRRPHHAAMRRRRAGPAGAHLYVLAALACMLLHLCLEPRLAHDGGRLLAAAALGAIPLALDRWRRAR